MATSQSLSEAECTCPVCCDIFKDPAVLLCGHSFCECCLQEWWRRSWSQTCPVCMEVCLMRQPPRNLALRNLSDNLRQEKSRRRGAASSSSAAAAGVDDGARETDLFCALHGERLELFCVDDRRPVCVVCRDSEQHETHCCEPLRDAAQDHKTELRRTQKLLRTKEEACERVKGQCDKITRHIKLQAQQTEKRIKEDFQKMHRFLRAEEASRIDALGNFKTTIKRAQDQAMLPDPRIPTGTLIDEAKHLGNVQYKVWSKMRAIINYSPVILNPNTACTHVTVSEDLTSVRRNDGAVAPDVPERASGGERWSVRGSEWISSGGHTWEVEVDGYWAVGVTTAAGDVWGIYRYSYVEDWLHEITPGDDGRLVAKPPARLTRVMVLLEYDQGALSFYDLDGETHLHTIQHAFTQPVFPCFRENVKILPVESGTCR